MSQILIGEAKETLSFDRHNIVTSTNMRISSVTITDNLTEETADRNLQIIAFSSMK